MKAYIVTRHRLGDGFDSFKVAAFTSLDKAREFMRDSFNAAVQCFKDAGVAFGEGPLQGDTHIEDDSAWIILNHDDLDERQFNITEVELDEENFSFSSCLG